MKKSILLFWAYASELLLAALFVTFSYFTIEKHSNIVAFLCSKIDLLVTGVIAILCAKVAVFIYHMTLTATEFGSYLTYAKADNTYKNSFIYSIAVDFICIAALIGWVVTKEIVVFRLVVFFSAMTALTLFTILQNIFEIVRMNNAFIKRKKQLDNDLDC